jgi:hypothetical protein
VPRRLWSLVFSAALIALPVAAFADADEPMNAAAGLQPITGTISPARPFHGESPVFRRADGAYQAIPEIRGRTKIFHFVEREAPWTLRPGLTVTAKTYNGVVPGPTVVVNQGDHVVIDLLNALNVADTLHLHGIHGGAPEMDGVGGMSQTMIEPGRHFSYAFDANQSGTFMYHSHGAENMVDAGLYGGIIVRPNAPRLEEIVAHDYLQIISSWKIQSLGENHFTINGKSYPATKALDIASGQRVRIRWINMSAENDHTMHTHGHDQLVIARDAQPLEYRDLEDTVLLGPGQRVDVTVLGNAKPGTWMMHCHVLDHIEDENSMPDGLVGALHYAGTPNTLTSMNAAMTAHMPMPMQPAQKKPAPAPKTLALGTTLILGSVIGLTMLFSFLIVGSRRLPRETILGMDVVVGAILAFLLAQIYPNLTYQLFQSMRAWAGGSSFPLLLSLALLSGLVIGFASTAVSRYKKNQDGAALVFAQGLAVGASAISGATLLMFFLVVGFTIHNIVKGCDAATRLHFSGGTIGAKQIVLAGCLVSIPIIPGMLLGYALAAPACTTFFFAIATGALIYAIGEIAADILVIVGSCATTVESESSRPSSAFTLGGLQ